MLLQSSGDRSVQCHAHMSAHIHTLTSKVSPLSVMYLRSVLTLFQLLLHSPIPQSPSEAVSRCPLISPFPVDNECGPCKGYSPAKTHQRRAASTSMLSLLTEVTRRCIERSAATIVAVTLAGGGGSRCSSQSSTAAALNPQAKRMQRRPDAPVAQPEPAVTSACRSQGLHRGLEA